MAIQRENVMNRLVRLREEIGHPDKHDKPLPQDQAAARAGVTVRQWQRWESGESVPYARNLSEVADAFGFDVGEFYDGPAGKEPAGTPSPFPDKTADGMLAAVHELLTQQNALLQRQSAILERIEQAIGTFDEAAKRDEEAEKRLARAAAAEAIEALRSDGQPKARARAQRAT